MHNSLHKVIPEALQILYMTLVPLDFCGGQKKKLKKEQHRKKKQQNAEI